MKPKLSELVRYKLDTFLTRGASALLVGLGFMVLAVVAVVSTLLLTLDLKPDENASVLETIWVAFMHTYDNTQIAYDEGEFRGRWSYRAVVFIACIAGLFIFSTFIGVITNGIASKLEALRKGKSRVVESGHILILGWSDDVFSIVSELQEAYRSNKHQKRVVVCILAERDKIAMEDELRSRIKKTSNFVVLCRTGSPTDSNDLRLVNPESAKSILVLSPPESSHPDAVVLKILLAITNNRPHAKHQYKIIAAIQDRTNLDVARLIGNGDVHAILVDKIISHIVAQTCRQPGLSEVYRDLLDFGGAEIYFKEITAFEGLTYGECQGRLWTSTLIGIRRSETGQILLNPVSTCMFKPGDQAIVIANDLPSIRVDEPQEKEFDASALVLSATSVKKPERTLILGYNHRAPVVIRELDKYLSPGSLIHVVIPPTITASPVGFPTSLENASLDVENAKFTDRDILSVLQAETYDQIILLSDDVDKDIDSVDASAIVTLIHLREILSLSARYVPVVTELKSDRNRALISSHAGAEFVVSSMLTSFFLAQLSENIELEKVFETLFSAEGSEIYLKPASEYVKLDREIPYYTLVHAAKMRSETVIGYRIGKEGKVTLNPEKSVGIRFVAGDQVIVLAEEE